MIIAFIQDMKKSQKNNEHKYQLKWTIGLGVLSWICFIGTFSRDLIIEYVLNEPIPTQGYAPHNFYYNISIILPLIGLSFSFGLACFLSYIVYIYKRPRISIIFKTLPLIGLLPLIFLSILLGIFIYKI